MHKTVNGQYGIWSSYGSCSKSCDSGVRTKRRTCNNPAPAYGGSPCSGSASHSINCNTQPCLSKFFFPLKEIIFA